MAKNGLRKWVKEKWVDIGALKKDGKYQPCGRSKGEKRAKYPSCKPTPSRCKDPGKGTKWGKKK